MGPVNDLLRATSVKHLVGFPPSLSDASIEGGGRDLETLIEKFSPGSSLSLCLVLESTEISMNTGEAKQNRLTRQGIADIHDARPYYDTDSLNHHMSPSLLRQC